MLEGDIFSFWLRVWEGDLEWLDFARRLSISALGTLSANWLERVHGMKNAYINLVFKITKKLLESIENRLKIAFYTAQLGFMAYFMRLLSAILIYMKILMELGKRNRLIYVMKLLYR